MNTDKLKEEFLKEFGYKHYDINNNLAYCEFIDDTVDPQEVADWWLKKWQERELALWQAMEEKKREIYCKPNHIKTNQDTFDIYYQYSLEGGYNQALSEAQSLLSVNSSKE